MRIRHESLAAAARAGKNVEANRATLREAGSTAAKGRASDITTGPAGDRAGGGGGGGGGPGTEGEGAGEGGGGTLAGLVAAERLGMVQGNPGSEEWLKEVSVACLFD